MWNLPGKKGSPPTSSSSSSSLVSPKDAGFGRGGGAGNHQRGRSRATEGNRETSVSYLCRAAALHSICQLVIVSIRYTHESSGEEIIHCGIVQQRGIPLQHRGSGRTQTNKKPSRSPSFVEKLETVSDSHTICVEKEYTPHSNALAVAGSVHSMYPNEYMAP